MGTGEPDKKKKQVAVPDFLISKAELARRGIITAPYVTRPFATLGPSQ